MSARKKNENKEYMLRVRMDLETLRKLDFICSENKIKRSEMTRVLIEKEYEKHRK